MFDLKDSCTEFAAGLAIAFERGWPWKHESGTYVKLLPPGEGLLSRAKL